MAKPTKKSYTIPCASAFRDAVTALADKRQVNPGDLARSVMLALPKAVIDDHPDPGEPASDDREAIILKSGPAAGRPWRRKPRLQVRTVPGCDVPFLRKALGLVLEIEAGRISVTVQTEAERREAEAQAQAQARALAEPAVDPNLIEEIERLRAMVSALAFDPLPEGVSSKQDALHVLGFHPEARPDERTLRARYRMLATIHHPDGHYGNHERMSQINAAMDILRRACA